MFFVVLALTVAIGLLWKRLTNVSAQQAELLIEQRSIRAAVEQLERQVRDLEVGVEAPPSATTAATTTAPTVRPAPAPAAPPTQPPRRRPTETPAVLAPRDDRQVPSSDNVRRLNSAATRHDNRRRPIW